MRLGHFCFLACLCFLAGCARVSTTTTISADGSYSRKIAFTVSKTNTGMGAGLSSMGDDKSTNPKPPKEKPEDFFKLPNGEFGFKLVRSEDKSSLLVTATRDALAGAAPVQDIALWAEKGKVLATSTVSVNKLADGRIEYVETLHATSPKAADKQLGIPELRARVKKVLPGEHQTTAIIDKVTEEVGINYVHAMFGPPEPTLFSLFMSPDAVLRRVNAYAFLENVRSLRQVIPGLSEDQAKVIARSLAEQMSDSILDQTERLSDNSKPKSESSDNEMTPLTFAVRFPGRIVETNGIIDPITGEVYWSLLPAGLDVGDARLRLVIQP